MGDAAAGLRDGFSERLETLLTRHYDLLSTLSYDEARELGEQGADAAVAPLVWDAAIGERWPTTMVTEFLHVTRQALHKRVVNGSAVGLAGRGTTWFPVWQFDLNAHQVRPEVVDIAKSFRDAIPSDTAFVVASWATTDQPELGMSPEQWLSAGKDPAELVRVARRTANELSR
jgi:hypothetical protein